MGDLADGTFELIWADGELRGTPRLVERFRPAAQSAGEDVLAFIGAVEKGLGTRPQLIVWPDRDRWRRAPVSARQGS